MKVSFTNQTAEQLEELAQTIRHDNLRSTEPPFPREMPHGPGSAAREEYLKANRHSVGYIGVVGAPLSRVEYVNPLSPIIELIQAIKPGMSIHIEQAHPRCSCQKEEF